MDSKDIWTTQEQINRKIELHKQMIQAILMGDKNHQGIGLLAQIRNSGNTVTYNRDSPINFEEINRTYNELKNRRMSVLSDEGLTYYPGAIIEFFNKQEELKQVNTDMVELPNTRENLTEEDKQIMNSMLQNAIQNGSVSIQDAISTQLSGGWRNLIKKSPKEVIQLKITNENIKENKEKIIQKIINLITESFNRPKEQSKKLKNRYENTKKKRKTT
jgi:hypothetical protein